MDREGFHGGSSWHLWTSTGGYSERNDMQHQSERRQSICKLQNLQNLHWRLQRAKRHATSIGTKTKHLQAAEAVEPALEATVSESVETNLRACRTTTGGYSERNYKEGKKQEQISLLDAF